VVFFPALLVLAAKESRNVRIGIATPFGATEKTYRIFVEELPPLVPPDASAGVRVLTKMGVPIFLQPSKNQAQGGLRALAAKDGVFRFEVRNLGNVHLLPQSVRIRGLSRTGEPLIDKSMDGWYVLAGGTREYELPLPPTDCRGIATLAVEVQIGSTTLQERLETSAQACAQ
jgi:fimbrial chaperone protein